MKVRIIAAAAAVMLTLAACQMPGSSAAPKTTSAPETTTITNGMIPTELNEGAIVLKQFETPKGSSEIAVMHTTEGDIVFMFFPEEAPKAVENFLTHAKNGYYDGIIFHRVIKNFMIQGGDPLGMGYGGESIWKKPFEDEFSYNLYNFNGSLSMANSGANTNGSQFFIVNSGPLDVRMVDQLKKSWPIQAVEKYSEVGGTPHLDRKHTVFGHVLEGMDIVHQISSTETDRQDRPLTDVVIKSIDVMTYDQYLSGGAAATEPATAETTEETTGPETEASK